MNFLINSLIIFSVLWVPVSYGSKVKTNFAGCTPERTLFFAYTKHHTKAVEFCEVPMGYRYTYGPIHQPEITVIAPDKRNVNARLALLVPDRGTYVNGFIMPAGSYLYKTERTAHPHSAQLLVMEKRQDIHEVIARIPLDDTGWGFVDNSTPP